MSWAINSSDGITSALSNQSASRDSVAQAALSRGATALQNQQYDVAVTAFKMGVAYASDPTQSWTLLARTYGFMGKTDASIDAYKRALASDPSANDVRAELARKYLDIDRTGDAETQYQEILKRSPQDAGALESLGYLALKSGKLAEADAKFTQALRVSPRDSSSYYSLGLLRVKQGRPDDAIDLFQQAIALNPGYAQARADLAFTYLDVNRKDLAREQMNALYSMNTQESVGYATGISNALWTPEIAFVDSSHSSFKLTNGSYTKLADLDPSLATPGASATLTVRFQFNQAMDLASVQNALNWSIARATGGDAGVYDNGYSRSGYAQAQLPPIPLSVSYDPLTNQATIRFRVTQNAAGNAVIDPQHWVFQFSGVDATGRSMDPAGDQYDGWAGRSF